MNRIFILLTLSLISFQEISATHTKGGWMYYEYLGPGISDPTKLRYRIGLNLYMVCNPNPGVIDNPINFSIFSGTAPFTWEQDVSVSINANNNTQNCIANACYPCMNLIPTICYKVINYETIVELTPSSRGYIISKQRCCRILGISNLAPPSDNIGATYTIRIPPPSASVPNANLNSSPKFVFNDTAIVCANAAFTLGFSANDPDSGDSLVYSFCEAYRGGDPSDPNPTTSTAPVYPTVPYQAPFSGAQPLGSGVTIDPVTGIISGIAPAAGEYVLTVCVSEYRNGVFFAESRKELHLKIADCFNVSSSLGPDFTTCGDLNLSFQNLLDNPTITSWLWDFGDPASGINNTSNLQNPSHSFSAPGTYTVKLVVNPGHPCSDSTLQVVSVFPGFFPGFRSNAPFCAGRPVSFTDTTRTNHGTVTGWFWDFGDPTTLADTSRLQNPSYTYNIPGTYTVKLVVGNTKGCRDSLVHDVVINANPIVNAFPIDTTYCARDSIRIRANGTGSFNWTPATFIQDAGTNNPLVFPNIPTTYYATLTDANGCRSVDSVRVTPLNDLANNIAANPAIICQEDTLLLTGSSNRTSNLRWQWSPSSSVQSPNSSSTRAWPNVSTTYTLTTTWGQHCVATKTINIPVTPLAIPEAGPDGSICAGQSSVTLNASGGDTYSWSPATGLNNTSIRNPVATPSVTTLYTVSVGVNGCSKRRTDTVRVTVRQKPPVSLTNDTLICIIDTLRLNANGTGNFVWSPNYMISNTTVPNPLVSPDAPTLYRVRLTDSFGCFSDDSVFVSVKPQVTLNAGPDTSICRTEGYMLRATGDALTYTWIPPTGLSDPNILNPIATPDVTTTYTLVGNIGKCEASSPVKVTVAPYPIANAGMPDTVCFGFSSQLHASGGSIYSWTPSTYLSDHQVAEPLVINPSRTTTYIVFVSDTLGCTKIFSDTVKVTVIPRLNVDAGPSDTTAVDGQPIQLHGSGALNYLWSPSTWLNNINIANPVSNPLDSITYYLTGTDEFGCLGTDSIHLRFFTMDSDMYVPTAFTPNGDGLNDLARPIMLGMKSLSYFRIYNRFGELVFETSQIDRGWDGIYKGKPQATATFVWMAEGVTFKGQIKKKKGYVVLIR